MKTLKEQHAMSTEEKLLADLMKKVLADSFCFYLKAHFCHWNVEGSDFYQYHELFGAIYEEVHSSIDKTAENIRYLGEYSPGSPMRFQQLSDITPADSVSSATQMASELLAENQKVLTVLQTTFKMSERLGKFGLSDHLASRIDAHEKHSWMLRSILKK